MKHIYFIFLFVLLFLTGSSTSAQKIYNNNSEFDIKNLKISPKIRELGINSQQSLQALGSGKFHNSSVDNFSKIRLNRVFKGIKSNYSSDRKVPVSIEIEDASKWLKGEVEPIKMSRAILQSEEVKIQMRVTELERFVVDTILYDELGTVHVKMIQYHKDIPILGTQIILHFFKNNSGVFSNVFINGNWFFSKQKALKGKKTIQVGKNRSEDEGQFNLREEVYKSNIKSDITRNKGIKFRAYNDDLFRSVVGDEKRWQFEKYYMPEEVNGGYLFKPVYSVSVVADVLHRYNYVLDANDGEILDSYDNYCSFVHEGHKTPPPLGQAKKITAKDLHNKDRQFYVYEHQGTDFMIDISRDMFDADKSNLPHEPVGAIWTIDANDSSIQDEEFEKNLTHVTTNSNTWDKKAVSAHYNAGFCYDYYKNNFNRNAIDGNGGTIVSIINVADENGNGLDNAFWSGTAMFYGNGNIVFSSPLAKALDVSGHEMTHGVIQSASGLKYSDESGAINESFADIFGALIDGGDWRMGEDIVNTQYYPSGALRDLSNPHNGGSSLNQLYYQPAHYSERYIGTQDNGGVHINSGIPNFAFYKFATQVGLNKAKKVYYKTLNSYITKSANFVDLKAAIERAAQDLYGEVVKNAATKAFEEVGIGDNIGGGSNAQQDIQVNPGEDYILCVDSYQSKIQILNAQGEAIGQDLSTQGVLSKPSITDDGKIVVFVGEDYKMYYILIDWETGQIQEGLLAENPIWRNAVISKDGNHIAALTEEKQNNIYVYDFSSETTKEFELVNPTTAKGVQLGYVDYADAMEFDYSGEWLLYDCKNSITSNSGLNVEYWDMGFIKVWDNNSNSFGTGHTEKLFSELPDGISIGNPTFSKNSPYIISFDITDFNQYKVVGANVETGDIGDIFKNSSLGYPSYSRTDEYMLFDYIDKNGGGNIAYIALDNSKIKGSGDAAYFANDYRWGVWFSNGVRNLNPSSTDEYGKEEASIKYYPNPAKSELIIESDDFDSNVNLRIFDILGNVVYKSNVDFISGKPRVDVSGLKRGNYIISLNDDKKHFSGRLVIMK